MQRSSILGPVLAALITAAGGVLAALITAKLITASSFFTQDPDQIILVGSGTVADVLNEAASPIVNDRGPAVLVLQGGTHAGASIFSEAYHHGSQEERIPVLAMASRRLEEENFVRMREETYFEVVVGIEPVWVTLGAKNREDFDSVFKPMLDQRKDNNRRHPQTDDLAITPEELRPWVMRQGEWKSEAAKPLGYTVFATQAPNSATRALVDTCLSTVGGAGWVWPSDLRNWDQQVEDLAKSKLPWIAIGRPNNRAVLNDKADCQTFTLLLNNTPTEEHVDRGLYLYGRLYPSGNRYLIDKRTTRFLRKLLRFLESSPRASDLRIRDQQAALHLEEESGWLDSGDTEKHVIYGFFRKSKGGDVLPAK